MFAMQAFIKGGLRKFLETEREIYPEFHNRVNNITENPVSYFAKLRESKKPGGQIVVIDWKKTKLGHISRARHCATEEGIRILPMIVLQREESTACHQSASQ